jgi:hypothetical protein
LNDAGSGRGLNPPPKTRAEAWQRAAPATRKKKRLAMTNDLYDANGKIKPDLEDIEMIERQCGPLPVDTSNSQDLERYRLAAAVKLIRLYAQGKLPPELMREMDSYTSQRRR